MQARMNHPVQVLPAAMEALISLNKAVEAEGVPYETHKLVHLRASQINGCSACVDMHARELKKAGVSDQRIFAVSAWREAPFYSEAERAALALTEALTRLADKADAVPDALWEEVRRHYDDRAVSALALSVAMINLWNRLNVAVRQPAGGWA